MHKSQWVRWSGILGCVFAINTTSVAELTGNLGVTTNYVFRGQTQTDDGAAIQGGVDYTDATGFYAGAWASNVDFVGAGDGFEVDLYAGISLGISDAVNLDIGYILYEYTDSANTDASELFIGVSLGDMSLTYYDGETDPGSEYEYIDFKYKMDIAANLKLDLHFGRLEPSGAGQNINDISAGISRNFSGFDVSLVATYEDSDPDKDNNLFLTVVKTFDL